MLNGVPKSPWQSLLQMHLVQLVCVLVCLSSHAMQLLLQLLGHHVPDLWLSRPEF